VPSREAVGRWLKEAQELDCVEPEVVELPPAKVREKKAPVKAPKTPKKASRSQNAAPRAAAVRPPPPIRYSGTPNPVLGALVRICRHTTKELELGSKPYDPWKAWEKEKEKWGEKLKAAETEEQELPDWVRGKKAVEQQRVVEKALETIYEIEKELGGMPSKGLLRVAKEERLGYACADPDATLRVAMELERDRGSFGGEVVEEDWAQ
jgi:hypothetical protein